MEGQAAQALVEPRRLGLRRDRRRTRRNALRRHVERLSGRIGQSELLKGIRGDGHERQWLSAIRDGGQTDSNFAVSGPLTELLMLGNVATLVGRPFTYDPVTGTVLDNEAAQAALHQEYREGWTL